MAGKAIYHSASFEQRRYGGLGWIYVRMNVQFQQHLANMAKSLAFLNAPSSPCREWHSTFRQGWGHLATPRIPSAKDTCRFRRLRLTSHVPWFIYLRLLRFASNSVHMLLHESQILDVNF
jgi:hypothetical protein